MTSSSAGAVLRTTGTPLDAPNEGSQHAPRSSRDDKDPRTQLVELIVSQIRSRGYFRTCLPPVSEQEVVDMRWTAQFAGRALDRPVRTHVRRWQGPRASTTVIIAPTKAYTEVEAELQKVAQATIDRLHVEEQPS